MSDNPPTDPGLERAVKLAADCLLVLTIMAALASIHWLRSLVTPLMVAIVLLILMDTATARLAKLAPAVPGWLRAGAAFLAMAAFLACAGLVLVHYAPRVATDLIHAVGRGQDLLAQLAPRTGLSAGRAMHLLQEFDIRPFLTVMLVAVQDIATGSILVVIYVGFLLVSRTAFRRKLHLLFPDQEGREQAARAFSRIVAGTENYIWLQTFKAALLGLTFFAAMMAVGLPNALFLAVVTFFLAYVPIVGPAVAVAAPVLMSVVRFDLGWRTLALFVALQALVIVIDNILLPRLQSDRLDVDPVAVLLSLGFWSAILGPTGALLSTVLTVVVIAIAAENPNVRWLAITLSKKGDVRGPDAQPLES